MENFTNPDKAVGIIIDVSLRHDTKGNRLIDCVKESLIELVTNSFENNIDVLYLYHPDVVDPVDKHGEQRAIINNYQSDGWAFNIDLALRQTLYAIALQDFDMKRYLVLITDRINNIQPLETILKLNNKDRVDARVIVIGIGDFYAETNLLSLRNDPAFLHIHLDHPSEISIRLDKETT